MNVLAVSKDSNFELKCLEFSHAIEKYHARHVYRYFEFMISVMIVALQGMTLLKMGLDCHELSALGACIAIVLAYLITDFVNGLVHMYMDNNTRYTSLFGPFIAMFHFHHSQPKYTQRHPFKIYFYESKTKFWLFIYLVILIGFQFKFNLPSAVNLGLVCIGVFSSLAEVSHYWCHNATNKNTIIRMLQRCRILLSRRHHALHHISDNTQYAFLNGLTDPLLNLIARHFFDGYKNNADQHAKEYRSSFQ